MHDRPYGPVALGDAGDGDGNVTRYGYDGHDRRETTSYADGSYEQAGYDTAGRVVTQRRRDGSVVALGHDALGRVVSKTLPGDEGVVRYDYDLAGQLTQVRRAAGG